MIDLDILRAYGTTPNRLREIFERTTMADPGSEASEELKTSFKNWQLDQERRKKIETQIADLLNEGVSFGLKNSQFYAAVDLAWDTPAVSGLSLVPLMLYTQGKVGLTQCAQSLTACPTTAGLVQKDPNGAVTGVDWPKFLDVSINMVRSYVTRRHAAQSVKYANLYPHYKYEARDTSQVGKLRADVASQEAEIITDGFGNRHHDSQVMRDGLLYGHCIDFVRCSWEVYKQQYAIDIAQELKTNEPEKGETRIVKEGVSFVHIHPSRVIADNSEPLPAINDDVGPKHIGYWDIARASSILDNPMYYNTKDISYGSGLWTLYSRHLDYFSQYFCNVKPPPSLFGNTPTPVLPNIAPTATPDPAMSNERSASVGVYTGEQANMSVFKSEIFLKLVPVNYGIGTYPWETWFRFVVASDSTVIYAEPLPSSPAVVLAINERDSRQLNASFAHDVMWAQDMMSNLVTQLALAVQGELLKVIGINTDIVNSDDIKKIESRLKGTSWASDGPIIIPFSLKQLADEMEIKTDAVFKIGETNQGKSVEVIFRAMTQLLALVERMTAMSPAEQGQPAPREISATEVTEIASTTQNVYSFISDAVDEFRAAKKRIIYESLVCCKQGKVQVPVIGRYSKKTIADAGFEIAPGADPVDRPASTTVIGARKKLIHDLVFTTRDGSERPVNTQAANTLVQLVQGILAFPPVLQALGKQKLYDLFNEIFRMSGTGVDLNLEVQEGDSAGFGDDQIAQMQQILQQLQQAMQEIAQATEKNSKDNVQQEEVNKHQEGILDGLRAAVDLVKKSASDINTLLGRADAVDEKLQKLKVAVIPYQYAPEEIRRQIEANVGMTPARSPTYLEEKIATETAQSTSTVTS